MNMKKFEYKVIVLKVDRVWTGKVDGDYLQLLNEYGVDGWKFVAFVPGHLYPKAAKGQEILFEREILD